MESSEIFSFVNKRPSEKLTRHTSDICQPLEAFEQPFRLRLTKLVFVWVVLTNCSESVFKHKISCAELEETTNPRGEMSASRSTYTSFWSKPLMNILFALRATVRTEKGLSVHHLSYEWLSQSISNVKICLWFFLYQLGFETRPISWNRHFPPLPLDRGNKDAVLEIWTWTRNTHVKLSNISLHFWKGMSRFLMQEETVGDYI